MAIKASMVHITHVDARTNDWVAVGDTVILSNGVTAEVIEITFDFVEDSTRTMTQCFGFITVRTANGNTLTVIE